MLNKKVNICYILIFLTCFKYSLIAKKKDKLIIYTPRSFTNCYGTKMKEIFEKKYDCEIEYIYYNGMNHLKLSLSSSSQIRVDLVVSIDYDTLGREDFRDYFRDHNIDQSTLNIDQSWTDKKLIPYEQAIIAFVYDTKKIKTKINSFQDILNPEIKIIITDPRIGSLGLRLLSWIKKVYGEESKKYWKSLSKNILTTVRGWSEGYALFLKGECDMVLSYITSPAYHRIKENKTNIKAAIFQEGHYIMYYVAGIPKKSKNLLLAKKYIEELIHKKNQKHMIFLDWVHPIVKLYIPLPPEFSIKIKKLKTFSPAEVKKFKNIWIDEWIASF